MISLPLYSCMDLRFLLARWALFPIFLFLTSCLMVGPDYKEPKKTFAAHWLKKQSKTIRNASVDNEKWWEVFHDKTLTHLIHLGLKQNLSLQGAGVRVLQARAQLAQTVGFLYPQKQGGIGNLTYNRIGGSELQEVLPTNFNTSILGGSANWEIDFWGKYRRAILSKDAAFLASVEAYHQALVTLTSDIASTYVNIRTTQDLIQVTKQNVAVQAIGVRIAKARFKTGEASMLDVEQSETELSKTKATLPNLAANLQKYKDALAVLLGTTPDKINPLLRKNKAIPHAPISVAVGIPREVIVKRPDVYQARLEAVAQAHTIGAVKAELFPAFSLAGTFAMAANTIPPNSLSELFNWSNRSVIAGPAFNWSILNYGQITNAVRAQDALYQRTVLNYLDSVLKAQKEVQDNLTDFIETQKARTYLTAANRSAVNSTKLALIRYQEGESDYTPVLNSERQQLQAQISLTNARGDVPKALIALYRSLGGGWQISQNRELISSEIKAAMAKRTNWGSLLKKENHQAPKKNLAKLKTHYLPNW